MSDHQQSALRRGIRIMLRDPQRFARTLWRMVRPWPRPYRRWQTMNLYRWMVYHETSIAFTQCTWMGKTAFKNPLDAWIYQEILHEVRPDIVIEIGSAYGGSTLYLAHMLDLLGHGMVLSIDSDRSHFDIDHPRILPLTGHSSAPEIVMAVASRCAGQTVLVIHDGDHRKTQVLRDLECYAPLISPGSYLIVEDGIIDLFHPHDGIGSVQAGPLAAINQFLRSHPHFEVDQGRERYILTYNPRGFLRKMRAHP